VTKWLQGSSCGRFGPLSSGPAGWSVSLADHPHALSRLVAVIAVCKLSYLSYLLQKYVPVPKAALLPAILGGLYSSTATTVVLAKRQREVGPAPSELVAGIIAATAAMYVRLRVVIALFNVQLAWVLAPARVHCSYLVPGSLHTNGAARRNSSTGQI